MARKVKNEVKTKRVDGYLHRVVSMATEDGKTQYSLQPLSWEFKPRDFFQILIGAAIIGTPLAFTEEVWTLGQELPMQNALFIAVTTLVVLGLYVYFNFYRYHLRGYLMHYFLRVFLIYFGSIGVVTSILLLVGKAPFFTDPGTAIKRIIIIGLASSMSATVSDSLK